MTSLAARIRVALNAVLRPFDVELLRRSRLTADPWARLHLLTDVSTVIDVGVGDAGSPFLYRHFPKAHFISVDPLEECRAVVAAMVPRTAASSVFHATGLGRHEGELTLRVAGKLSRSSFRDRSWAPDSSFQTAQSRTVPITTLSTLLSASELVPGVLLKIDTEGFELEVLQGCTALLPRIQYVLLEISTTENFDDGESVAGIYSWLAAHGFTQSFVVQSELVFMNVCFFRSGSAFDAFLRHEQ